MKWLRSIRASGALQTQLRDSGVSLTRVEVALLGAMSVGDRENDLFDAFVQAKASDVDVLISGPEHPASVVLRGHRAAQDRRIAEDDTKKLWDYVTEQTVSHPKRPSYRQIG